uniref:Uncharacterized protein n=1 Tax=Chromera velia CCMP2878 TaxID=1169474 RepID=A0A0G4I518_9ALVE|mmetsp:Transcript_29220/g.57317  ORF Transcript_29220/g.57317 Transcript_29220/m.57317 type:complete len:372 (-) Transcript_29220:40-1155(-)|eukprot:Cvel_10991.t1-p1 / transcript=Cvel_10991.t1 / gene=Cvel_10991 / organism=Chromera_velia_CCMP2878 / gene_product=Ribonucleoside-diphosphate reductase subunit M2, putative / transcript_product=Ribonucleoside-diphosphate reductase subunit M2, putative / location=Cvel_scaffold677:5058-8108(+) / protein_length=371 / sequence_SO=supercontig / SO=protein_coding / is_pseudo=false
MIAVPANRVDLRKAEEHEVVLQDNPERWVILPIKFPTVWDMFKRIETTFWTAEDVDFSKDHENFEAFAEDQLDVLKKICMFNFSCNGKVYDRLDDITARLMIQTQLPESRAYYGFQIAMETIHKEAWMHAAETYVHDKKEREELTQTLLSSPSVQKKRDFMAAHLEKECPFSEKLVAVVCMKRIFTATNRALLSALHQRNLIPGLGHANTNISRDEKLHGDCACLLFGMLHESKLEADEVEAMIREAVEIEEEFCREFVETDKLGLSPDLIRAFVDLVAASCFRSLQVPVPSPFDRPSQQVAAHFPLLKEAPLDDVMAQPPASKPSGRTVRAKMDAEGDGDLEHTVGDFQKEKEEANAHQRAEEFALHADF